MNDFNDFDEDDDDDQIEEDLIDPKINELLLEYDDHRAAIKSMIVDIEKLREKIDTLIPETLDHRYMRFFEEKVKTLTAFFSSLLEMRKEIAKSLKDEIEIRRKLKKKSDIIDVDDMVDIRGMANKIDEFTKEKNKLQQERMNKNKNIKLDESIIIPGLNDE